MGPISIPNEVEDEMEEEGENEEEVNHEDRGDEVVVSLVCGFLFRVSLLLLYDCCRC